MKARGLHLAPWIAALLVSAGCATSGDKQPPSRLARAIQENHRGEQFFARGEYKTAMEHFRRALRDAESIENEDAIAANLINLSIVQQRLGDRAAAASSVERILNEGELRFGEQRLAEAAVRRSLLALEAGAHAEAKKFTELAQHHCRDQCGVRGKVLGLRGYLALASGNGAAAEALGMQAVAVHRAGNDREELANGLRLVGSAAQLLGDPARGLPSLEEALAIDKRLALPRAVVGDLLALGRAHEQLGNADRARGFFERAVAAAKADGNAAAVEQANGGLRRLPKSGSE